jgi:hypothetical protein
MPRAKFGLLAAVFLVAACAGGDSPTDPNDPGNGGGGGGGGTGSRMTATVDGQAWSAASAEGAVVALQHAPRSGGYIITGLESVTGAAGSILITINNIAGPGTYPLGVDAVTVYGGFAGITATGGRSWTTPISGAAGSITITALTTTRIAGTFNFTADATAGGATGTRVVTNGVFDAPIQGNAVLPALTDSMGGKMSATVGGQAWNAAIIAAGTSPTHFSLSGINNRQTLVITIPKPTATGTYTISNNAGSLLYAWDPNAVAPAGTRCCWGIAGDVGTMTVTSLTITRAKGTFSATLRPQPGTAAVALGQLVIANGTFDVGLYHR